MHDRLAAFILLFSSILFSSISLHAAEIRGKVVSVTRGEPLARVQVAVLVEAQREAVATAITTKDGSFVIQGLASGHYMLRLNAVGYRLITVEFSLAADEAAKEFDITLVPDNFRRTERVEVKGDIFQGSDSPAINEIFARPPRSWPTIRFARFRHCPGFPRPVTTISSRSFR